MSVSPWTQTLRLTWTPTLRFFEERVRLLREFEDAGTLRGFQVQESRIAARLRDPEHHLEVTSTGITLRLLSPACNPELMESTARSVIAAVRPTRARGVQVGMQYLVPLDRTYSRVREETSEHLLRLSTTQEMYGWDWAVLIDGETEGGTFQVEFGVVEREEIPVRLAQATGRMSSIASGMPPEHWEAQALPEVALFADTAWEFVPDDPAQVERALVEGWRRALVEGERLISKLQVAAGLTTPEPDSVPGVKGKGGES